MLLQELPENQDNMKKISTGYAVMLLVLYWLLEFVGQGIGMLPQIVKKSIELSGELTTSNSVELTERILDNLYYPWYVNGIQLVSFILILWLFKRRNVTFFSKETFSKKELLQIVGYGVALVIISTLFEQLINYVNPSFNTANQESLEKLFVNSSRLTMFISVVILAPITEEVMFRGVFSVIFKKFEFLGVLICAVIFTLFHMPTDLLSFLVYFIMALGLGAIYWKTRRIEASIFAHMLNNFLGFILMLG